MGLRYTEVCLLAGILMTFASENEEKNNFKIAFESYQWNSFGALMMNKLTNFFTFIIAIITILNREGRRRTIINQSAIECMCAISMQQRRKIIK